MQVLAPCPGRVFPITEVSDPVFAAEMVGPGIAIDPAPGRNTVVAPVAGTILKLHPHAFAMITPDGVGVLVHLGINTVQLEASGAQIASSALPNEFKGLPTDVTIRDVVSTYIYTNTLVVWR